MDMMKNVLNKNDNSNKEKKKNKTLIPQHYNLTLFISS